MRFEIRYATRFDYQQPVRESANELRACPSTDRRQQLVDYRVTVSPSARVAASVDYFGTRVDSFSVREPHTRLEIVAESVVETAPATPPPGPTPRTALGDPEFRDEHFEYLVPTAHADWGPAVAEEAARRAERVEDVVVLAQALHDAVSQRLTYAPGATFVGTPVDEVYSTCEGVCQDFAHLALALCRSQGLPARYVSGYLFAADDASGADTVPDTLVVQTHAWTEVAVPGAGWWAFDPTNQQAVGARHVRIGHGRDYDDVPPLRGVFSGPQQHEMHVDVEMRRHAHGQ